MEMKIFAPAQPMKGSVLIAPAMGVEQKFYAPLAAWLASEGYQVATFDYRGMNLKDSSELKNFKHTDLFDWAKDAEHALASLAEKAQGLPVYWIGHSLGGQLFGLIQNHSLVHRAMTIASGSGYWLQNAWSLRWRVWFLWFVVVPIATPLCGYFPGKKLKMVGDLPSAVMWQWRRWCLNSRYAIGVEGKRVKDAFAAVKTPITGISFTDDELMSKENIDSLHSFYTHSSRKMLYLRPADYGLKSIRHFGFFREKMKDRLWKPIVLPELQ